MPLSLSMIRLKNFTTFKKFMRIPQYNYINEITALEKIQDVRFSRFTISSPTHHPFLTDGECLFDTVAVSSKKNCSKLTQITLIGDKTSFCLFSLIFLLVYVNVHDLTIVVG